MEGPKFMMSHALTQINVRNILPVLLPVLSHKSFAQSFCRGHALNSCFAELASNLNAKVGLFTSSNPRQHKKCVFFNFHTLTSLRL